MSKKIISTILLVLLTLISFGACSFRSISPNEKIVNLSADSANVCAVTNNGNVYFKGGGSSAGRRNGIDSEHAFGYNLRSLVIGDTFFCIYDKGDAVKINYNTYGGVILTQDQSIYLFLNEEGENYQTVDYLCSGYVDAQLYREHMIYVLSDNGEFGFITVDYPDNFHLIASNIQKFKIRMSKLDMVAMVLTGDNELYIFNLLDGFDSKADHFKNVIDFDFIESDCDQSVFGLINSNNEAYACVGNFKCSYESISNEGLKKVGTGIKSVTSHGQGVAMLDVDDNLLVYGSDLSTFDNKNFDFIYQGEIVLHDIQTISGSTECLCVVTKEGEFTRYGSNGDNTRTKLKPK